MNEDGCCAFGVNLRSRLGARRRNPYLGSVRGATPDYKVFRGEPGGLRHPREIFHEAIQLDARGLIQLGLLLLMLTPWPAWRFQ